MNGLSGWFLAGTSFLASSVEAVEAMTIVLAVGIAHSWRVSLQGAALGVAVLAVLVAVLGPLLRIVPLGILELVIGLFLILFGLAWLRKAILRYSGRKALRDEDANFAREVSALRTEDATHADRVGFFTVFNAVLLEGLEVAIIVITFGAASNAALWWATVGALVAVAIVIVAGIALRRPASRVPENLLKFIVGLMLVSLGTYWAGEGLGIEWWRHDVSVLLLVGFYTALSVVLIAAARSSRPSQART